MIHPYPQILHTPDSDFMEYLQQNVPPSDQMEEFDYDDAVIQLFSCKFPSYLVSLHNFEFELDEGYALLWNEKTNWSIFDKRLRFASPRHQQNYDTFLTASENVVSTSKFVQRSFQDCESTTLTKETSFT